MILRGRLFHRPRITRPVAFQELIDRTEDECWLIDPDHVSLVRHREQTRVWAGEKLEGLGIAGPAHAKSAKLMQASITRSARQRCLEVMAG